MKYPREVLAKTKTGKIEVRSLIDKGKYIRYEYLDPKTGKPTGKIKLILKGKPQEEFFIIRMKKGSLMLKTETKGKRKVLDKGKIVSV